MVQKELGHSRGNANISQLLLRKSPRWEAWLFQAWLHTATMTTSSHWSYLTPQSQEHLEIWNPHRGITDSTVGLIQPQATAQVSFPSAKLEQYTFPSPKFDIRGGIHIPFIFPRHFLQQHSWKPVLSYTSCTVFESYFPKKWSLHGLSLCVFLCVLACLNLFSQNWPMVDQLWHVSWI